MESKRVNNNELFFVSHDRFKIESNNIDNIPTEVLIEEINKRKKELVPKLIKELNDKVDALRNLGFKIENYNDACYEFGKFEIAEESGVINYTEV